MAFYYSEIKGKCNRFTLLFKKRAAGQFRFFTGMSQRMIQYYMTDKKDLHMDNLKLLFINAHN